MSQKNCGQKGISVLEEVMINNEGGKELSIFNPPTGILVKVTSQFFSNHSNTLHNIFIRL